MSLRSSCDADGGFRRLKWCLFSRGRKVVSRQAQPLNLAQAALGRRPPISSINPKKRSIYLEHESFKPQGCLEALRCLLREALQGNLVRSPPKALAQNPTTNNLVSALTFRSRPLFLHMLGFMLLSLGFALFVIG
jgi:hypothetical protein